MNKSIVRVFLAISIVIITSLNNVTIRLHAEDFSDEEIIDNTLDEIEQLESIKPDVVEYRIIYGLDNEPSYLLLAFEEGYAIASREYNVMSEYNLEAESNPYSEFPISEKAYYGGALYYLTEEEFRELKSDAEIYDAKRLYKKRYVRDCI